MNYIKKLYNNIRIFFIKIYTVIKIGDWQTRQARSIELGQMVESMVKLGKDIDAARLLT